MATALLVVRTPEVDDGQAVLRQEYLSTKSLIIDALVCHRNLDRKLDLARDWVRLEGRIVDDALQTLSFGGIPAEKAEPGV
jgi:hypothetical protein